MICRTTQTTPVITQIIRTYHHAPEGKIKPNRAPGLLWSASALILSASEICTTWCPLVGQIQETGPDPLTVRELTNTSEHRLLQKWEIHFLPSLNCSNTLVIEIIINKNKTTYLLNPPKNL